MSQCPTEFKPLFYRRYLDDTFAVFPNEICADRFFNFINSLHNNVKFTIEKEQNCTLPFLDTNVNRESDGSFQTSIYRKSTHTGLATSYFSFIRHLYKINAMRTLIYRAYHLSSTYIQFSNEIEYLQQMFTTNGYPLFLFQKYVNKFLHSVMNPPKTLATVPKQLVYISFPYLGPPSHKISSYLKNALASHYPHVDFKFCFKNNFQMKSLFKYKDLVPFDLRSKIIYKYKCETCNGFYIGSSIKQAKIRFTQHLGISFRTGRHLSKPMHSTPRLHSETEDHSISYNHFSIIDQAQ